MSFSSCTVVMMICGDLYVFADCFETEDLGSWIGGGCGLWADADGAEEGWEGASALTGGEAWLFLREESATGSSLRLELQQPIFRLSCLRPLDPLQSKPALLLLIPTCYLSLKPPSFPLIHT